MSSRIEKNYEAAKETYAELFGVDTDAAINAALDVAISLHCWQADDVAGFEVKPEGLSGGGIMATGNYPGRARNGDEVRQDMAKAMELIPGKSRANVHASYCDTDGKFIERDQLTADHFSKWIDWAKELGIDLDFNPTAFAHPMAEDGFTLSHQKKEVRDFWIRHFIASRKIAQAMAEAQAGPCFVNHWIPDGSKDIPADRFGPRARLADAYDQVFSGDTGVDREKCVDFVESKLFGIGSEEFVVGSSEFYSNYALSRGIGLCMDMGHYHPTETIHGKISSHLQFHKELLLHVSRPIRWDSDHIVIFNDDLKNVFLEVQRGHAWDRVKFALDFFDASINRIGAYVIGTRAARKGILYALLDPTKKLQQLEAEGKNAQRLALMEEAKSLPFASVWDMLCLKVDVPVGPSWISEMEAYEVAVLAKRS